MRGWSLAREVYDVWNLARFFEFPHDAHGLGGDRFLCLVGRSADVVRAVESVFFDDVVIEFAGAASWLDRVNVEARTNAARLDRFGERLLVHHFATRGVDEVSALAHRVEEVGVDRFSRLIVEREMNADDVCF